MVNWCQVLGPHSLWLSQFTLMQMETPKDQSFTGPLFYISWWCLWITEGQMNRGQHKKYHQSCYLLPAQCCLKLLFAWESSPDLEQEIPGPDHGFTQALPVGYTHCDLEREMEHWFVYVSGLGREQLLLGLCLWQRECVPQLGAQNTTQVTHVGSRKLTA